MKSLKQRLKKKRNYRPPLDVVAFLCSSLSFIFLLFIYQPQFPASKDLFSKSIGPTRRCFLTYGPNGQSKGIATVIFQRKADAGRACEEYNGRLIDGTRKMKIEIVLDPSKSSARTSFSQRIAPSMFRRRAPRRQGRRSGRSRTTRIKKTVEELDAEMMDYFKNANQEAVSM